MVLSKGDMEVVHVPLPFKVFIKTRDGQLTLKAAFATDSLAGAWVIGLSTSGAECRICEERDGEFFEVTPTAVAKAAKGMEEELKKRTK